MKQDYPGAKYKDIDLRKTKYRNTQIAMPLESTKRNDKIVRDEWKADYEAGYGEAIDYTRKTSPNYSMSKSPKKSYTVLAAE